MKGIIFDMDNTILRSKIDFDSMKRETFKFLKSRQLLPSDFPLSTHTTSTLIAEATKQPMTDELIKELWEVPTKFEVMGTEGADLEPGAKKVLDKLHGTYTLVIVTNNSVEAAKKALQENDIWDYFDYVVGREHMGDLKPAPDGFLYVLDKFKQIPANEWISIGDSWIDGKASAEAGITFISYQAERKKMQDNGVHPHAEIEHLEEFLHHI